MKFCAKKTYRCSSRDLLLLKITIICMCVGWQVGIQAQDLQVSITGNTEPSIQVETLIAENKIIISDASGVILQQIDYTFPSNQDPSFLVYGNPSESIIRENIANFLWINREGKIIHSESNSSGSEDGEVVSELATDPQFRTQVIYNPKIVFGNSVGSSAQIISSKKQTISLHFSTTSQLRRVHVSKNGAFIALVTAQNGLDDLVKIFDRYGNSITQWEFSQPVEGVEFSQDGRYHTLFSGGRVGVYDSYTSQRVGSSSVRGNPILTAAYLPSKSTIAVITADVKESLIQQTGLKPSVYPTVTDLELHQINIVERRISRQKFKILDIKQFAPINLSQKGDFLSLTGLASEFVLR